MRNRVTQSDVAKLAGVSRFTVSCVINNLSGGNVRISDETRQRVLQAIEQLGYRPNLIARSLRTSRTQIMAIMAQDLTNPFYPRFIRGAQSIAQKYQYQILVFDANESAGGEQAFIDSLLQGWVDGAILFNFRSTEEDIAPLLDAGIRIITIGARVSLPGITSVISSETEAVSSVMKYLYECGHRRIAHLAGMQDTPPGRARFAIYRKCLENFHLPFDENLVRFGAFTAEGVDPLIDSLFFSANLVERPTALFAANDRMAIRAMKRLQERGLKIPQVTRRLDDPGFQDTPAEIALIQFLTQDHLVRILQLTQGELRGQELEPNRGIFQFVL